jgi:hypothetical protein
LNSESFHRIINDKIFQSKGKTMTSKVTSSSSSIHRDDAGDTKSNLAGTVHDTLTQETVQVFSRHMGLHLSSKEKADGVSNIMALKKTTFESGTLAPAFTLSLEKREEQQIDALFARWALNTDISLFDLWGVDLFTKIEAFIKYLPEAERQEIIERFCAKFALAFVSMTAEGNLENMKIEFYQKGVKSKNRRYVWERPSLIEEFQDIKKTIRDLIPLQKLKIKTIRQALQNLEQHFDLGCKLLAHPQALTFLTDFTCGGISDRFPKAVLLSKNNPTQSLEDLTTFTRFYALGFTCAIKQGHLGISKNLLEDVHSQLLLLAKSGNKQKAAAGLKKALSPAFQELQEIRLHLKKASERAYCGKLTKEEYYGDQVKMKANSPEEFASQLYATNLAWFILEGTLCDCLFLLDEQVMEPLYPETYVPTRSILRRFSLNLRSLFDIILDKNFFSFSYKALPSPPAKISEPQQHALEKLAHEIRTDVQGLFSQLLSQRWMQPESMISATKLLRKERVHFSEWIPFLKTEFEPTLPLMEELHKNLAVIKNKHLTLIQDFLKTMDPKDVQAKRKEWTAYFQDLCFHESLDFCRLSMMTQDLKAILQMESNLNAGLSEEDLLPDTLVDYMELEGIDTVFAELFPPPVDLEKPKEETPASAEPTPVSSPSAEKPKAETTALADVPAKPPKKDKLEHKGNTPAAAPKVRGLEATVEPEPFRIRRGEKTRKILKRLRDIGMLPKRQSGTAHKVLKSDRWKTIDSRFCGWRC